MRIALFTYDAPHAKSRAFLDILLAGGYEVAIVLAAPMEVLDTAQSRTETYRAKAANESVFARCRRSDILYQVVRHGSAAAVLRTHNIDLGVIGGARILPKSVIDACRLGILNIHPGLLPQNRGLDAMQAAVARGLPQAVTAHLIDETVDGGSPVVQMDVPVYRGDTTRDVSMRLYEAQLEILPKALALIEIREAAPVVEPVNRPAAYDDFVERYWDRYLEAFGEESPIGELT